MTETTVSRIVKLTAYAGLSLALLAGAATADAQSREGSWEFTLGGAFQLSNDIDGEGGSTLQTDDAFGLGLGGAYNFNERLSAGFGFQWYGVDYDANVVQDDGSTLGITGSYDVWNTSANLTYNFMDGAFTPYVGAGIGWTWIDTNIPNGLPSTGCWWDPWWGYVCYSSYPTKTEDAFSYQATVGLRYAFNPTTFMRFGYTAQWMDFSGAESTPQFDVLMLEIGWLF